MKHPLPLSGHICLAIVAFACSLPLPLSAQVGLHFAVIGDYGFAGQPEADVAALVKSWKPDLIITAGDNNYDWGADSTIDRNIGQYYHEFISPYPGSYGKGDTVNRFFPSLGNHDWRSGGASAYLKYFTLPGNERYYEFVRGPVHFYALDSDENEPDGVTASSKQAMWLKAQLQASTSPWNVVYFHHAPYSSGAHGSSEKLQWPFREWGASVVITGHDHTYERVIVNGFPYFVNGLGGRSIYELKKTVPDSKIRFVKDYGAMDVVADGAKMTFRFVTRKDSLVDTYTLTRLGK
jgi:hypothetical protein